MPVTLLGFEGMFMRRLLSFVTVLAAVILLSGTATAMNGTILVFGKVVDMNGDPVNNATVKMVDGRYRALGTTLTDAYGNYEVVRRIETNTTRIEIDKKEQGISYNCTSIWYPASEVTCINVKIESYIGSDIGSTQARGNITVVGKVIDTNGMPVENAIVSLQNGRYQEIGKTVSDAGGCFYFVNIDTRSDTIRARTVKAVIGGKYNNTTRWYPVQNYTVIDVRLLNYPEPATVDSGWIKGIVKMNGYPVPGAQVILDGSVKQDLVIDPYYPLSDDRSNPAGNIPSDLCQFKFRVPAGNHSLYAYCYGDGKILTSDNICVSTNVSENSSAVGTTVLEVRPLPGDQAPILPDSTSDYHWEISGRAVNRTGGPLPGTVIFINDTEYGTSEKLITDDNGCFSYQGKHSGLKSISLGAEYNDGENICRVSNHSLIRMSDGRGRLITFNFFDVPAKKNVTDGYIWGIITTPEGSDYGISLPGTVYLNNGMSMKVDDGGQFIFNVPAGDYDIYAVHENGNRKFVSKIKHVTIIPTDNILSTDAIRLVVEPENKDVAIVPLLAVALTGIAGFITVSVIRRRMM